MNGNKKLDIELFENAYKLYSSNFKERGAREKRCFIITLEDIQKQSKAGKEETKQFMIEIIEKQIEVLKSMAKIVTPNNEDFIKYPKQEREENERVNQRLQEEYEVYIVKGMKMMKKGEWKNEFSSINR